MPPRLMLPRLMLIGTALAVLTAGGVALHAPGQLGIGSDMRRNAFVAVCLLAGVFYAAAVRLVLRRDVASRGFWGIIAVALLLRAIVLPAPAFLSNDINRYIWDGRVQAAGINPYRYVPTDPALAFLHDRTVFPFINRADTARTIYPPLAQAVFLTAAWLSPSGHAVKVLMVGAELIAMAALVALLRHAGLPRERMLIYAWHPLPVWEFAGNGHVDALAIACVALALLATARLRPALAGIALAGAVLAKVLPGVVLAALWRPRTLWLPAAFVATLILAYLPYLGVGPHVLGYLPGYAHEEGISTGQGIYWLALLDCVAALPRWAGPAYLALLLAVLGGLSIAMTRAPPPEPGAPAMLRPARDALVLGTVLMVAITPHYAWYFAWLLVPACVVPSAAVLFLTLASFTIYQDPIRSKLLWQGVLYAPFALLLLTGTMRRHWPLDAPARSR